MPIRINLLAEQQAAEELRRRDPVKRAIWVAGFFVVVVVVWSGYLQFKFGKRFRDRKSRRCSSCITRPSRR